MKKSWFILVAVALLFGLFWLVIALATTDETVSDDTNVTLITPDENQLDEEPADKADDVVDEEVPPAKVSNPPTSVDTAPQVFTTKGQDPSNKIQAGELVTSVCVSDPEVECKLTITSKLDDTVYTFPTKTTGINGSISWEWTGVDDVKSGEYLITVSVGDKKSVAEEVYVQ